MRLSAANKWYVSQTFRCKLTWNATVQRLYNLPCIQIISPENAPVRLALHSSSTGLGEISLLLADFVQCKMLGQRTPPGLRSNRSKALAGDRGHQRTTTLQNVSQAGKRMASCCTYSSHATEISRFKFSFLGREINAGPQTFHTVQAWNTTLATELMKR